MSLFAGRIWSWVFSHLDGYVPQDVLHGFITDKLADLEGSALVGQWKNEQPSVCEDLAEIKGLIREFDLPFKFSGDEISYVESASAKLAQSIKWAEGLCSAELVSKGGLQQGAGYWMERLLSDETAVYKEWLSRELERLLRHIEVKKKHCLSPIIPAAGPSEEWIEKHRIAILLAKQARRSHDLRFLNTALKLNEWAYQSNTGKKVQRTGPNLVVFVRALLEQEAACKDLLSP